MNPDAELGSVGGQVVRVDAEIEETPRYPRRIRPRAFATSSAVRSTRMRNCLAPSFDVVQLTLVSGVFTRGERLPAEDRLRCGYPPLTPARRRLVTDQ